MTKTNKKKTAKHVLKTSCGHAQNRHVVYCYEMPQCVIAIDVAKDRNVMSFGAETMGNMFHVSWPKDNIIIYTLSSSEMDNA